MFRCIIIFFLLSHTIAFSQDWALFPYVQKSYYQRTDYLNTLEILVQDSISNNSYYFNRKTNQYDIYNCIDELWDYKSYEGIIDSLVFINDTTYYYYSSLINPFYFLNKSEPGESWIINSDYETDGYSQIKITCIEKNLELVQGIFDSVKSYNLFGIGLGGIDNPLDTFIIKLSKTFGLIEYFDFNQFLIHPDYYNFTRNKLLGTINEEDTIGFIVPEWKSFFNYQIDDIRIWQYTRFGAGGGIDFKEYYSETFTNAEYFEDSIVYTFNTLKLDRYGNYIYSEGNKQVLKSIALNNIVNAINNFYVLSANWLTAYEPENPLTIWENNSWRLDFNNIPGDTILMRYYNQRIGFLDTSNCTNSVIVDNGFSYSLNSFSGIDSYDIASYGLYPNYLLIGYKIGDILWGELNIPTQLIQLNYSTLSIFPNPASNNISLQITITHPLQYAIYNIQGQLIKNGMLTENTISVSELTSGMYILEVRDNESVYRGKFIKE